MCNVRIVLVFIVSVLLFGFTDHNSNDCSDRRFFQKGFSYRNEKFIAGDIPAGHATVSIDSVVKNGDSLISFFTSKGVNAKGAASSISGFFVCYRGELIIDPMSFADLVEQHGHLTVQASQPMKYPFSMESGDTLIPWKLYFTIIEDWGGKVSIKLDGKNRRCIGTDSVRVADQAHQTYLVESRISTAIKQGGVEKNQTTRMLEWVSPIYGVLRTESYVDTIMLRYSKVTMLSK